MEDLDSIIFDTAQNAEILQDKLFTVLLLAILRKYFGILGGIKHYPPSLPMYSETFPVSDSFRSRLTSKITQLKLDSLWSKLFRIRFAVYTQVEKNPKRNLFSLVVSPVILNLKFKVGTSYPKNLESGTFEYL